jgi:hypothetical protein
LHATCCGCIATYKFFFLPESWLRVLKIIQLPSTSN